MGDAKAIDKAGCALGLCHDADESRENWNARVLGGIDEAQDEIDELDARAAVLNGRLRRAREALLGVAEHGRQAEPVGAAQAKPARGRRVGGGG